MKAYEVITNRILEMLEQGVIPWKRPWRSAAPRNLASGKEYRGINTLLLSCAGFSCPVWATFKQIKAADGSVKKGSLSVPVVYWNWIPAGRTKHVEENKDPDDASAEPGGHSAEIMVPFLRYYNVFNLEQTTLELPEPEVPEVRPIAMCERILAGMPQKPSIDFDGGDRAYYRPINDSIHLPLQRCFASAEAYYATLFHELIHSTGHEKRLARKGVTDHAHFGSETYSAEELVAEIGAAFLCGHAHIETATLENSAAYVQNWLTALRNDKKMVITAAAQAQHATEHILGIPQ
jgi:antirestriction protein ArdC